MAKFTIKESNQGEYSKWWIQCHEDFDYLKEAKSFLKSLGIKPKDYNIQRE